MRYPDLVRPWAKQSPREASGTGVVIEGKRILTNAHVVLYASQLFVETSQSGDKRAATVESVSPGMDLAVLKLEDESFFEGRTPLPPDGRSARGQGERPRLRLSPGGEQPVDHQGDRLADRVRALQRGDLGPAGPGRRGDQPRQQRRPGRGQRHDGRPGLQQARRRRTTSATSSPARRSTCSSRTSPTAVTTASPRCTTSSRPWRTTRFGAFSASIARRRGWSSTTPTATMRITP